MASRICRHCKKNTHITLIGDPKSAENETIAAQHTWFACFQCDNCGYFSTGKQIITESVKDLVVRFGLQYSGATQGEKRAIAAKKMFEGVNPDLEWIPEIALGKEYDDVDNDTVKDSASEGTPAIRSAHTGLPFSWPVQSVKP